MKYVVSWSLLINPTSTWGRGLKPFAIETIIISPEPSIQLKPDDTVILDFSIKNQGGETNALHSAPEPKLSGTINTKPQTILQMPCNTKTNTIIPIPKSSV